MKSRVSRLLWLILFLILSIYCCSQKKERIDKVRKSEKIVSVPNFIADSAYQFIFDQVNLGPRVPNSPSHRNCATYLVKKLKEYGGDVTEQDFTQVSYDGTRLYLKNIIASFNPDASRKILMAAHWDTRPFADKDSININNPIDGANDGGSGVGVLLEIARIIGKYPSPDIGVDIILFDGEDYGEPESFKNDPGYKSTAKIWWCLGSQYWSENKHIKNYSAYYGILLDMVGGKNAKFYKEGGSMQFARKIVAKVWKAGNQLGYQAYFIDQQSPGIMDDHVFVNRNAKIPMINIVEFDPNDRDEYFGSYHHTHRDNMDIIDPVTLKAVGQTLLHVIYHQ
ncbi:M28 family peptidase [Bacteroidota bacterium]